MNPTNFRPFVSIMLASFVLLGLNSSGLLRPITNVLTFFTEPVIAAETVATRKSLNFFTLILSIKNISRDNTDLLRKNQELQGKISKLNEVVHENEILRQELNFIKESEDTYLPAQLIGRTATGVTRDLIVNRGARDAVTPGQPVLAQGFLVGLVSRVDVRQSTITLLANPRSIVPVLVQQSRATGLLRGGLGGLTMTDLLIDATVATNDTVVTSGLGGDLPGGIPVGKIVTIRERKGDITKEATIASPIDVTKLEMVFIRKSAN